MTATTTSPATTEADDPTSAPRHTVLLLALLGTLLLGILEMNIVTSAATSIGRELDPVHGIARIPWLVTAYALASCIVQPIYGKLADRYGVKPVFLWTVGVFMGGSLLCAVAGSMEQLILFRAIQGLGGGGLMSVTFIVFGHLSAESGEQRRTSALAGMLVGLGLVAGPVLGGQLVDHAGWRWVFLINLPLAGAAWLIVARRLQVAATHRPTPIDVLGTALLSAAAGAVLLACEWGGQRYAWTSPMIVGLGLFAALSAMAFAWRQTTAPEPYFPPRLLRHRIFRVITVLQLVAGIGLASTIVYVTLDLQLVHGISPSSTGLHLLPMAAGLVLASIIGSRLVGGGGPVRLAIAGGQLLGGLALAALALTTSVGGSTIVLSLGLALFGFGLGLGLGNELVLVQTSVGRHEMGVATTGLRFVETIGAGIGASAFGVLFTSLTHHAISPASVASALHWVFGIGAVLLVLASALALRLPDVRFTEAPAAP
ncbi:MAG: MFS transporter [Solirubrobacteraceae bacterium]|nr:MFS transporter [Solirubrobacteraceae bacterium]